MTNGRQIRHFGIPSFWSPVGNSAPTVTVFAMTDVNDRFRRSISDGITGSTRRSVGLC
jgi:hypothetical protein